MYVKDKMTKNPVCIKDSTSISEALEIMSNNNFHRLPVLDESGRLLGLITEEIISENAPTKATSYSMHELNYLLYKTKVNSIMDKNVEIINSDALIEEAVYKMRRNDISCLPVVDNGKVVGIITYNDVFDAFMDILGFNTKGSKYVMNVSTDEVGVLLNIANIFAYNKSNIKNFAVYHRDGIVEITIVSYAEYSKDIENRLRESGYDVVIAQGL